MSPLPGFGRRKTPRGNEVIHRGALQSPAQGPGGAAARKPSRAPTLLEVCSEAFSLAYTLRTTVDLGEPGEVRRKILQLLERIDGEARQAGFSTPHVDGARFAVVALIDEAILSSQWPGKATWVVNPLQRELFKMNVAGERFYTDVEQLRQNPQENRPLLEVYYACLIMGFEGRYKLLGREKLEGLIRALASELTHGSEWKMENLSPAWRRPDDFPEVVGEGVPVWATIAGVLGIALIMVVIFAVVSGHDAGEVARHIQESFLRTASR